MSVVCSRSSGASASAAFTVTRSVCAGEMRISPRMFRIAVIAWISTPIWRSASASVPVREAFG